MVGVVGTDFPENYRKLYEQFGINLEGLQIAQGKTFRWSGVYEDNMDHRKTLSTDLNVFENFSPELPDTYKSVPNLFLGNIAPELQLHVLNQINTPRFVLADTMDLWINIARDTLVEVISRVNMLTLNESEARLLTQTQFLRDAAEALLMLGPDYVLIKRGENGSILFSTNDKVMLMPAYPVKLVKDPTGAGDTFAGGLMGYLSSQENITPQTLHQAILHGNIIASFGVEDFSLYRLQTLSQDDLKKRIGIFRKMIKV